MWYHKIMDDPWQAVKWFQEAHRRPDILQARKNLLSHAYMRNGQSVGGDGRVLQAVQRGGCEHQAFES